MRIGAHVPVDERERIRDNFWEVAGRVDAAARRVGRWPDDITIVGVSKTQPVQAIRAAYDAGLRHFGENRVQEWEGKRSALADLDGTWHLVGHLQSNKAARAAGLFHSVDSIDDLALAERLERARSEQPANRRLRVLIEVRMEQEQSKSGLEP